MSSRSSQMEQRPCEGTWHAVWYVLGKGPQKWQLLWVLRYDQGFAWSALRKKPGTQGEDIGTCGGLGILMC